MKSINYFWILLLAGAVSAFAQDSTPAGVQGIEAKINTGTYALHCTRYGQGGPTVVLINGMGQTQSTWQSIVPNLAAVTSVFTYDPRNMGQSDKGPYPPLGSDEVRDLKTLLDEARMPKPYVLVAHSFGGMYARLFAATYPQLTAGLILIDAPPVGLNDAYLQVVTGSDREALKTFAQRTPRPMIETEKRVSSAKLPNVPLVVLNAAEQTSMRRFTPENREKCHHVERELGQALADLIPGGREIRVPNAGHAIHVDQPQMVVEAIRSMVEGHRLWTGQTPLAGATAKPVDGRQAYIIETGRGERLAWTPEVRLRDGVIEADIKAEGSYVGLGFRVQSDAVYEAVYFRPQNVRSDDPVKRRRVAQYIAHPGYDWYYLRERYPDLYEAPATFKPGQWFHVKLVLAGRSLKVYVDGAAEPCMDIETLNGPAVGGVGVWAGNGSPCTVANLRLMPEGDTLPSAERLELTFLWETFQNRRSARKFKPDPVPEADLVRILDMARTAPTSGNQQPWKFLVIRDREKLNALKDTCIARRTARAKASGLSGDRLATFKAAREKYFTDFLSAPVYVVVMTDTLSKYPSYNIYDGSLAGGYLMLAARALGYGTVFSQDSVPWDILQEVFEIPTHYQRICFTPIGVPETWPEAHGKKPLHSFIVWEKFVEGQNYRAPVVRKAVVLEAAVLDRYVGVYDFGEGTTLHIQRQEGGLKATLSGQQPVLFYPESETAFFMKTANVQIQFDWDGRRVKGLRFLQGGQTYTANRLAL